MNVHVTKNIKNEQKTTHIKKLTYVHIEKNECSICVLKKKEGQNNQKCKTDSWHKQAKQHLYAYICCWCFVNKCDPCPCACWAPSKSKKIHTYTHTLHKRTCLKENNYCWPVENKRNRKSLNIVTARMGAWRCCFLEAIYVAWSFVSVRMCECVCAAWSSNTLIRCELIWSYVSDREDKG